MSEDEDTMANVNPIFSSIEEDNNDPPLFKDHERSYFMEQSPYEEVSSNVSNHDDPTLSCVTFRSIFLGILFTATFSFINQFFAFRTSPLVIGMILTQLIAYPIGKFLEKILPTRSFSPCGKRWEFSFNPGPFTMKEHCIIAAMSNATSGTVMPINVIAIKSIYYNSSTSFTIGLFFILSSQLLGYSMVGLFRRFLVWPAAMIWPEYLVNCALFRTLHSDIDNDTDLNTSRWTISRYKFFYLALLFQVLWYWIPGYICPVLSYFSLFCVIFPNNIIVSQVTGVYGLGFTSFELDWNSWVAFLGSPIVVPFWAQVNIFVGFVVFVWIITPAGYYSNWWGAETYPIASYQVFTEDGYIYNVTNVLDSQIRLNQTAYNIYGGIRLSILFALSYGIQFAGITAILVHTILYDGKRIYKLFDVSLVDAGTDIHAKLMMQYPEVPSWWYGVLFIVTFPVAIIVCYLGDLMPWYLLFLDVVFVLIFLLPTGILSAVTNLLFGYSFLYTTGINVFCELIAGFIIPGNPIGNATFKVYGYVTQIQAIYLLGTLKLGHYMKIPPRTMFLTQILATIINSIICYVTAHYLLYNTPNICTPENPEWKCPKTSVFFSTSVIWGLIGPVRMFGKSSMYYPILYGFLIGAILPILSWGLMKALPKYDWLRYIHFPVLFSGIGQLPTAPPGEYPSWFAVGFFFNFILYRYAHAWWKRYAYLFSAAMSGGVAISAILIFFTLSNNNIYFPTWWGTGGITGDGCPLASANFSGDIPTYAPY